MSLIVNHQKFDMVRGVAAITVFLAHICQVFWYRHLGVDHFLVDILGTFARHAVLVFFLLSGYLITLSILINIKRNNNFNKVEYIASRIARIYPPLIGTVLVIVIIWTIIYIFDLPGKHSYRLATDLYVAREKFFISFTDIVRALSMKNGLLDVDGPLWSLYIEFHIYILALLATIAITTKGFALRIFCIILSVLFFIDWFSADHSFAFFSIVWFIGCFAAIAIHTGVCNSFIKVYKHFCTLLFVVVISLLLFSPYSLSISNPNTILNYGVQIGISFCYTYLIFFSKLLDQNSSGFLSKTGSFSYSLYIVHFPLLLLTLSVFQNWIGVSLLNTAIISCLIILVVLFFSYMFSRVFEQQVIFKPIIQKFLLKVSMLLHKMILEFKLVNKR